MKKVPGGVEDLTLGMTTEQQIRNGNVINITQLNGSNIPYSDTQSVNQKIEQQEAIDTALRNDLDSHKARTDNPHQIDTSDIGASPIGHHHAIGDVDGLHSSLNSKANSVHSHEISEVINLQTELDAKSDQGDSYLKTEHVVESAGSVDAGKPIVLDNVGALHPTIAGSGLYLVGMFTPTAGSEYPDTTGEKVGAYWGMLGLDAVNGYTFTGGDLVGETIYNNDALVNGAQSWGVFHVNISTNDYYRVDGTLAISAPFAGGGQQFKNADLATEDGDLVEYGQWSSKNGTQDTAIAAAQDTADGALPLTGGTMTGQIKGIPPVDVDDLIRKDYVDIKNSTQDTAIATAQDTADGALPLTGGTMTGALNIDQNGYSSVHDCDTVGPSWQGADRLDGYIRLNQTSGNIEMNPRSGKAVNIAGGITTDAIYTTTPGVSGSLNTRSAISGGLDGWYFYHSDTEGTALKTSLNIFDGSVFHPLSIGAHNYMTADGAPIGRYMFMAAGTDQTTDWDTLTQPGGGGLLYGAGPNGPGGYAYLHVFTYDDQVTQVAYPYSTGQGIKFRSRYQGTWGAWETSGIVIAGEIKQYSGKITDISSGWHIANGTKGTVDMSADFKTYGATEVVYIQYTGVS